ncbi:MAG TPA: ScyD/ScyE family protein [Anaerolineales bacterium]|nr:ScyD/ScyE family protein [Anaerolineales bacterium]
MPAPRTIVVAEGLINPVGLALLPDGGLLIAEEGTGEDDLSAGVSMLDSRGILRRVISGLPSSRDSGDLSGSPLVGVSPDGRMIYTAHFGAGHLWTLPADRLPYTGGPLGPEDLGQTMVPLNNVRLVNPFDITFSPGNLPVVSDASENGVAIENPDGTVRFFHRFADLPDTENPDLSIDPVPTGIARVADEYYVTLTGGCPYQPGSGQLVAIDMDRGQRIVAQGLDMPIDVSVGPDGTVWLLEFARFAEGASCFTGEGYQAGTGRLSRVHPDGDREVVLEGLDFPAAVLAAPDGSLYISEVFSGRVLKVVFTEVGGDEPGAPATPSDPSSEDVRNGPIFIDVAARVGLTFHHGVFQEGITMDPAAMMGAGLCWIDYDNDGWLDLYLVNSHARAERALLEAEDRLPTNALYRNRGSYFEDVSRASRADLAIRGNGCVAADFDGDGWWDLFITADGPNKLLWNNGDGTFTEGAAEAGLDAPEWNTAAVVGDLNADGLLDLFVGAYIDLNHQIPKPTGSFPQDFYGLPDRLYINAGAGPDGRPTFLEVTEAAGLVRFERALGALLSDLDGDGDLDLYIANDGQPNRLYANEPWPGGRQEDPEGLGFRFLDLDDQGGVGDSGSGMGIAGGDYNNDGLMDIFVTNWEDEVNALYLNQSAEGGPLEFLYATFRIGISGLGRQMTGWGTTWMDYDHDTDLDLMVVNGYVPVSDPEVDAQLVRLYLNRTWNTDGSPGEAGQFFDWTDHAGLKEVGALLARGSAAADFDNDGDLDVAINTIAGQVVLLLNQGDDGNWLLVSPDGCFPGLKVIVTLPDGRRLMREIYAGSSYLASEDPRLHFGLGDAERVTLTVHWPDGRTMTIPDVRANQIFDLSQAAP